MILEIARAVATLVFTGALATTASAQRILDWPLRTSAGPEAVTRGVEAAYWNPAAIANSTTRGEALIADQRAPADIGVAGFAAALSWRLDSRTTVAAGYQHVSIDDIGGTTTTPLPDTGEPSFSIAEDQVAIGVAHALGSSLSAGAGVRYDRSNETGLNENTTSLTAGVLFTPSLPLKPVVGASLLTKGSGVRYSGGLELGGSVTQNIELRGGYGVRGGENAITTEHTVGATLTWRQMVGVTAGVASADVGGKRTHDLVAGASLRVARYELGVLREGLANDFGAAYSFRFKVGLK